MALLLGIDTGGTYTDAALFDDARGVLASARALTTRHDLSIGIRNAIQAVLGCAARDIRLVSISTTLATNALVAQRLHTRLCIPEHAGIANAVGAVAGGVMQTARAIIRPLEGAGWRVHLPNVVHTLPDPEEAVTFARQAVAELAEAQARQAGAGHVTVETQRNDHVVRVKRDDNFHEEVFLECEVAATAVGRLQLAAGARG